jgi:hypothetical protein
VNRLAHTLLLLFAPRHYAERKILLALAFTFGIWPVPWWWSNARIRRVVVKAQQKTGAFQPWRVTME